MPKPSANELSIATGALRADDVLRRPPSDTCPRCHSTEIYGVISWGFRPGGFRRRARALAAVSFAMLCLWLSGCSSRVAPTAETVPPPPPTSYGNVLPVIAFTIQVGAFSTPERAADYADQLAAYGLDTYYFIDADGLCKVRFERFDSKAAAGERARSLQARGIIDAFYIVRPSLSGVRAVTRKPLQDEILATARRFIGTPYRWGGVSAARGFDCSGLTMTVFRLNGLELPRSSGAQYQSGRPVSRSALQKGDLVFFATTGGGRVSHVGIYSGDGRFIHAPGEGSRIRTASLSTRYFRKRYVGARRYF